MITRLTTTQAEADDQIMATRLANSRRNDTQEQIEKVRVSMGHLYSQSNLSFLGRTCNG